MSLQPAAHGCAANFHVRTAWSMSTHLVEGLRRRLQRTVQTPPDVVVKISSTDTPSDGMCVLHLSLPSHAKSSITCTGKEVVMVVDRSGIHHYSTTAFYQEWQRRDRPGGIQTLV